LPAPLLDNESDFPAASTRFIVPPLLPLDALASGAPNSVPATLNEWQELQFSPGRISGPLPPSSSLDSPPHAASVALKASTNTMVIKLYEIFMV